MTVQSHRSAHEFHQLPANGQTQSGAAKLTGRGTISLRKWLEKFCLFVFGNTHPGIPDLDFNRGMGFGF